MGRTRLTCLTERRRRRPQMESLEARTLLSLFSGPRPSIAPHASPAGSTNSASVSGTNVDQIVGASQTRTQYGVNGTGMTVAVIDTGVNYQNDALGGGFGPGHKVIAGFDFADNSPDPLATTSQHGTAVAGLIASSDPIHPGIAPGADIVALRVFGSSGNGTFDPVASALQWVVDHHAQYNITAVNISLSDGNNYTHDWFANDGAIGQKVEGLINQLTAQNIAVITADGNSFTGSQGIGFPAIIPSTINVTASDASDHLVSNAQRLGSALGGSSATDLAAPGANDVAPAGGNDFTTVTGTSFAAPVVTGAVVLLQQIYESRFGQLPSVNDLKTWLTQGSDSISDPSTGFTVGRLDIPKAASLIPGTPAPAFQFLAPPVQSLTPPPPPPPPPPAPVPPAPTPPPPPAPPVVNPTPTPGSLGTIYIDGQSVATDPTASRWSNVVSLLSGVFQSWGSAASNASSRFSFWGPAAQSSSDLGSTQPTGELAPVAHRPLPSGPLHHAHLHRPGLVRAHRHR